MDGAAADAAARAHKRDAAVHRTHPARSRPGSCILVLTQELLGREDPTLTDELLAEAPGIFNWSLEGLDRLHARGYFNQPDLRGGAPPPEDLASPVGAFVRDRCTTGPALKVRKDELWAAWKTWCHDEGKASAGTKAVFIRDLRAALPGIGTGRPVVDGKRVQVVTGITVGSP